MKDNETIARFFQKVASFFRAAFRKKKPPESVAVQPEPIARPEAYTVESVKATDEGLLRFALMLCTDDPAKDALSRALCDYLDSIGSRTAGMPDTVIRYAVYHRTDDDRYLSAVCSTADGGIVMFTVAGFEDIVDRATHIWISREEKQMNNFMKAVILQQNKEMAAEGLSVFGVAMCHLDAVPSSRTEIADKPLCFIGICGLRDTSERDAL